MRSTQLIANLVRGLVFAAMTAGTPTVGFTLSPDSADSSVTRLVVPVDVPWSEEPVVRGARIGRESMVYRFRAQIDDAATAASVAPDAWDITVYAAGANGTPFRALARLSPRQPDVALPHPYGYILGAADSLVVVVRVAGRDGLAPSMTVTIDHEPVVAASGSRGVLPHSADRVQTDSLEAARAGTRTWEWTPTVSGRMLFVTGSHLATAHEIVIRDAETGEVLRRVSQAGRAQAGADASDPTLVRMATHVQAGRRYQVTAYYAGGSADDATQTSSVVHALVAPGA